MAHQWLTFDRQVAELQMRIAVLTRYTALGKPVTEPAGQVRPGKGEGRSNPDLCNKAFLNHSSEIGGVSPSLKI